MPQYWYIVEALVVLAKITRHRDRTFTRADLIAASEKFRARPTAIQHALDHLAISGLVRRIPRPEDAAPAKPGIWTYLLTPEGHAAAKAARDARGRAAMSAGCAKGNKNRPRDTASFMARLWSLLRMRKTLSAADAAATLVDAGDDVVRAARTASKYLRAWSRLHPAAVQISAQRCRTGGYRFVLVQDLGPVPPVIPNHRARGGAS